VTRTIEALRAVARRLEPLETKFLFLGGAVIELLVDNPTVSELRPTKDVDVVAEVLTRSAFYALEEKSRDESVSLHSAVARRTKPKNRKIYRFHIAFFSKQSLSLGANPL